MHENPLKLGVIGNPVAHSLSPILHEYWLQQHGIFMPYTAIKIEEEHLGACIKNLARDRFLGINITIPHKEQALRYVEEITPIAKQIGAINTIIVKNGITIGTNTDAYGFIKNLTTQHVMFEGKTALVLGAGGAARAVLVGLHHAGCNIVIANRTESRAETLAQLLPRGAVKIVPWNSVENILPNIDILINTTSLGMKGEGEFTFSLRALSPKATVTDIVYTPLITPLLRAAQAQGNTVVDGLGMLLYQGQKAFHEWFGILPEVTPELRARILEGGK